ncbi:MAG: LPD7 domain-containing protein, partial [Sphingopyxis sp.]
MAQPSNPSNASAPHPSPKPKRDRSKKVGAARAPADAPVNAIAFGADRPRAAASGGTLGVERGLKSERAARGKTTDKISEDPRAKPSVLDARSDPIPDTVRERFIQIGNNFFFPDGAEAFTDHGNRVTTRSENAIVIQSMVAIAQARSA